MGTAAVDAPSYDIVDAELSVKFPLIWRVDAPAMFKLELPSNEKFPTTSKTISIAKC